jgi:hypothetical protein
MNLTRDPSDGTPVARLLVLVCGATVLSVTAAVLVILFAARGSAGPSRNVVYLPEAFPQRLDMWME